jgi:hypothetical protein
MEIREIRYDEHSLLLNGKRILNGGIQCHTTKSMYDNVA